MYRFVAALAIVLALASCRSPTRSEIVSESFSGIVSDAPASIPAEHAVRVLSAGTLNATLTWQNVPSAQPAGRAELRLALRDPRGEVLADTLQAPGGSPLDLSVEVAPGAYTLVVSPRFRDRIGFYCLCDVPYRLQVTHP